eukprot:TRINITY_DN1901_c0_g2_i1.p1 TRINITY_DN1901_c0_g2~~TRINITY_DN1901_c0_g2_i1.p1  ORF type:complete len:307 (+),score=83.00 TRINITY_DN1901_c0_g2_i1:126-1046(+)
MPDQWTLVTLPNGQERRRWYRVTVDGSSVTCRYGVLAGDPAAPDSFRGGAVRREQFSSPTTARRTAEQRVITKQRSRNPYVATERPGPLIGGLEGPSDEVPAAQFGGPPPQGQHPGPPPKRRHISPAPRLGAAPPTAAVAAAPQPVPPPVLPPVLQQPAAMAEQPAADKVKAQQLGPAQQGCKPHAAAAVPDNICKCTSRRCSVSVTVERLLLAIVFTMSFYAGEQYQSSRQLAAQRTEAAGRSAVQSAELQERLALTPPAPPHRRALIRSRVHSLVQVLVVSVLGALLACGYSELRYGCWFSPRC